MSNKNLVTQGELKNTVVGLDALAANLNDHVNDSMSKSHGWTGLTAEYKDSGGFNHSGPSPAGAADNHVVRIVVGDQVYYTPAQIAGGVDGTPNPTLPAYTGIISPQQADPSLDLTVGSPVDSALVTTFSGPINVIAGTAGDTLKAHAGSPPDKTHSGLSAEPFHQIDSTGHTVGRSSVILSINGVKWRIVCDKRLGGPPQGPSFSASCPQVLASAGDGGYFDQPDPVNFPCSWKDHKPDEAHQSRYVIEMGVKGTSPMDYVWEYTLTATSPIWLPLAEATTYNANGFQFTTLGSGAGTGISWITTPIVGTLVSSESAYTYLRIAIQNSTPYSSKNLYTNFAYGIRLRADNSLSDGFNAGSGMISVAIWDQN